MGEIFDTKLRAEDKASFNRDPRWSHHLSENEQRRKRASVSLEFSNFPFVKLARELSANAVRQNAASQKPLQKTPATVPSLTLWALMTHKKASHN